MTDLATTCRVLCHVLNHPGSAADALAAQKMGLSLAAMERCVRELVKAGMLMPGSTSPFEDTAGDFEPGPLALMLLASVQDNYPIARVASPVLRALAAATGERVVLNAYVPSLRAAVCVAMQPGTQPLQYHVDVGEVKSLHAGASGKAVLAQLSDAEVDACLAIPLRKVTPLTTVDIPTLRREVEEIRRAGFAVSKGQRIEGAVGLAAVVVMPGGAPGSLVITVPEHRFNDAMLPSLRAQIVACADQLACMFRA